MRTNYYLAIAMTLAFLSCSQEKIKLLEQRIDSLENANATQRKSIMIMTDSLQSVVKELESYQYSPERLLADAKNAYSQRESHLFSDLISQMKKYHPQAKELEEIKTLHEKLVDEINKEKAAEEAKRLGAVRKLTKRYDDVSDITWYYNSLFRHYNNTNLTSLYIGSSGYTWLRLMMSYTGSDWIFFEEAYLSYSGNTYKVEFDQYKDKKTENSGGYVWEWIDVGVSESLLSFLKDAVKDGGPIKMRLSGKYTKTRILSSKEVQALKDVLLAYDVLLNQ